MSRWAGGTPTTLRSPMWIDQVVNVGEVGVGHGQSDADDRKQDPRSTHTQEQQGHQQASQGAQGRGALAVAGGLAGGSLGVA